jgi:hypothetical protein
MLGRLSQQEGRHPRDSDNVLGKRLQAVDRSVGYAPPNQGDSMTLPLNRDRHQDPLNRTQAGRAGLDRPLPDTLLEFMARIAIGGQVVVRPMMYIALSYDHRIVDGAEAVQFLVRLKEFIEDPGHLLIEG